MTMEGALKGTYEDRCEELAKKYECLILKDPRGNDLAEVVKQLQAHVQLADYKVKFRQADHVKQLQYGPVFISAAGFVLSLVLAVFKCGRPRNT